MSKAEKAWRIVATNESITTNVDDSTLALQMGIAANAIGAAQRFYFFVKDASGPAGERDRLWAFLIAIGFIHEAVQVLRPNFPRIRDLARVGGVSEDSITCSGQLLSGRHPLSRTIDHMRNKLIFHWDEDVIREYVIRFTAENVSWAEGIGKAQGELMFRASADALTNSVLPDEPNTTEQRNIERLRALVQDIGPVMKTLIEVFNGAIMGHLKAHKTRRESR